MPGMEAFIGMVAGWPVMLQVRFGGIFLIVTWTQGPKAYRVAKTKFGNGNGNGHAASTRHAVEAMEARLVPVLEEIRDALRKGNEELKREFDVTRRAAREQHSEALAAQKHTDELILTRSPR